MTTARPLSTKEAAAALGVSIRTLNRWVELGKLPVAGKLPGRTGCRLFEPGVVELLRRQREERKTA
ncbi:helix-turn-helix domain-containing protein [Amycolatopsis alkalitolerans]|uniref:Helix-turn-helix domain-containing protein n=1 Tax=Amycolatopsis alkalitolerans TaxID=2547244 RepID=A0A5C4LUS8_9PSEU|nr:helix-turn-helix domain-containing protein [Amycolatopsis alkalitolerans]